MTRDRATTGGSGRLWLAVLLALAMLLPALEATSNAEYASASPDLQTRFENALKNSGATLYDSSYRPANEGLGDTPTENWYFEINRKGVAGTLIVERAQTEALARQGDTSLTRMNSGAGSVSINGVTGHHATRSAQTAGMTNTQTSIWWQRGRFFVLVNMFPTGDVDAVKEVAEILDGVITGDGAGGGTGGTGSEGEAEEPPQEPALSVTASPSFFSKLGDTAVVRVNVSGAEVGGKTATLSGHGQDKSVSLGPDGAAEFTVSHDDEQALEYRFTVDAEGMRREVVVPVTSISIAPEPNPVTQQPYAGVIADGRTILEIQIDLGAASDGTLKVSQPTVGRLEGDALGQGGEISLSGGEATVRYVPPAYLTDSSGAKPAAPTPESDNGVANGRSAGAVYLSTGAPNVLAVPLAFTYTDSSGASHDVPVEVSVTRTPVMLVHGFTGDRTTWAALQRHLGGLGFDAIIDEYYRGDQDIHDQSRALGQNIERELYRYEAFGIKGSRVDIVGHSMGGLIARNYAYGFEPHPTDVRKIIMVGTPNHGANFFDKTLGNLASQWFGQHKSASQQLYSGSAFLADLNDGEKVGRHLHPDIQYGNIYGVRTDYVVPHTSAYLNGVAHRRISGVTHSTAIPFPGIPITDSGTVFGWITDWLDEDIPRAPLRSSTVEIVDGQGEVYLSGVDFSTGNETREDINSYPRSVKTWEHVGTGPDGRARVRLSVAGLAWGAIDIAPDTLLAIGNVTPDAVTVRVRRGEARFRSLKREGGGHFQVVIGEQPPGEWYTFHPDAKIIGLDTDFVVGTGDGSNHEALVIEGEAQVVTDESLTESGPILGPSMAAVIGGDAGDGSSLAADQWWTGGFYRPDLAEVLSEWWAIARAKVESWFGEHAVEPIEIAEEVVP